VISQAARYAIRSLAYLESLGSDKYVAVRTISEELAISPTFLAKILKRLVKSELIDTYRGPNGGIRLTRAASTITIRQVIESVDGESLFRDCVLGLPGCGNEAPCPMHNSWASLREQLQNTFDSETIARLAISYRDDGARLRSPA
jgi:Rrf2 family iron-sulfur cluster assembly transcriptional regulator